MRLSFLTAATVLAACGSSPEKADPATPTGPVSDVVTIAYQSRVDGEIEPCG